MKILDDTHIRWADILFTRDDGYAILGAELSRTQKTLRHFDFLTDGSAIQMEFPSLSPSLFFSLTMKNQSNVIDKSYPRRCLYLRGDTGNSNYRHFRSSLLHFVNSFKNYKYSCDSMSRENTTVLFLVELAKNAEKKHT